MSLISGAIAGRAGPAGRYTYSHDNSGDVTRPPAP
jgi:hypothetical protein